MEKVAITKNGIRKIIEVKADSAFWEEWRRNKEGMKEKGYSVYKDESSGKWVVNRYSNPFQDESWQAAYEASYATSSDLEIPTPSGMEYLPYQRAGVAYAMGRRFALLADPMGLGKTIQAIGVMQFLPKDANILIICPASLRLNWKREYSRWDTRGVEAVIADSIEDIAKANVIIVNYDKLAKLEEALTKKWDLVILDESHYVKNSDAKRTKLALAISKQAKQVIALTGTPVLNRPAELWTVISTFDDTGIGADWRKYHEYFCDAYQKDVGRKKVWDVSGAAHTDELGRYLRSRFMIRRRKDEVLDQLPAKRRQLIPLAAEGELKRLLKMEQKLVERLGGPEGAIRASLHGEARADLAELTRLRREIGLAKVDAVVEHVLDGIESARACVVWTWHREVAEAIASALSQNGVSCAVAHGDHTPEERQAQVDALQSGEVKCLVATIKACGVGLTMTAANWTVFAELSWTPADIEQAEDRLHRIGQDETVLVQYLVVDQSLDAYIAQTMERKAAVIGAITE